MMKTEKNQFDRYLEDEKPPKKVQDIVPDEQINRAFAGTTYDGDMYRYHIKHALLKRACDLYICGSLDMILVKLGLSHKNKNLTGVGKSYLWNAFKSEDYE